MVITAFIFLYMMGAALLVMLLVKMDEPKVPRPIICILMGALWPFATAGAILYQIGSAIYRHTKAY